jgi:hypothetical protein
MRTPKREPIESHLIVVQHERDHHARAAILSRNGSHLEEGNYPCIMWAE